MSGQTIKSRLRHTVNRLLEPADLAIVRRPRAGEETDAERRFRDGRNRLGLELIRRSPPEHAFHSVTYLPRSQSQLLQDLFVLNCTGFRREGFFVEFGATDGKTLSNTWLLEKEFGWTGIVAEPARSWHAALTRERTCAVSTRCVWRATGERIGFTETEIGELSTLTSFTDTDQHAALRAGGKTYEVETISLNDLLRQHEAPERIDYISIDTEGSELTILESFDFSRHSFGVITVEHNHTENRGRIRALLEGHGYVNVLSELSAFDDWYVDAGIADRFTKGGHDNGTSVR